VQNAARTTLPPHAIVEGKIKQFDIVKSAVTHLVQETKVQGLKTAVAFPASGIVTHRLKFPAALRRQEYETEIRMNIDRYVSGNIDDICFDFAKVETGQKDHHDILLVTAPYEQVNLYATIATQAGLSVRIVDVDSYALHRVQEKLSVNDPFQDMQFAPHFNHENFKSQAQHFLVCYGLMMRENTRW
jgi:type IV pilus assembly protein PilM